MKKICYSGVGWGGRQRCKGPFGKLSYQICPSCTCSVVLFRPRANTVFQIEVKSYPLHHHFPEHMGLVLGFGAPPSFCHQLYVTTLFSEHPKPDLPSYLMDHHSHILNSGLHSLQDLLAITSPLSKLFMLPPKGFFFFFNSTSCLHSRLLSLSSHQLCHQFISFSSLHAAMPSTRIILASSFLCCFPNIP